MRHGAYASALPVVRDACMYHPHHRTLAVVHAEFLSGAGMVAAALWTFLCECIAEHGPAPDVLEMALALRGQQGPTRACARGWRIALHDRQE